MHGPIHTEFQNRLLDQKRGKEGRHAHPNFAQFLARISKVTFYRKKKTNSWKVKCIMVATGPFQDRNSSFSHPKVTFCTTRRVKYM